jgi:methylated-DNA-protein-cysteine methyltransferase-like protein
VPNFYTDVYRVTSAIPAGKVGTYGQIAAILGSPRAARMVGTALSHCHNQVPWQRVVNRHGMISIENLQFPKEEQVRLLALDGVEVTEKDGNFFVDLTTYLVNTETLQHAR